ENELKNKYNKSMLAPSPLGTGIAKVTIGRMMKEMSKRKTNLDCIVEGFLGIF
ncbi:3279_t:CDS:1, partial [Dentiscutata erythropus]